MSNPILEQALKYAAFGWRLHPCKKDKRPILAEWQNRATNDAEQIRAWWKEYPEASIGLACGPGSKVWALDIDLPDGPETLKKLEEMHGKLPATAEQITGSGGRQILFCYNGADIRNSARKVGPGIDVRGDGGYSIIPPSGHPSGGVYEWVLRTKPQKAPQWLIDMVKTEPEPVHTFLDGVSGQYGQKALAAEIVNVSMAGKGTRNDTLNKAAFRMGNLVAGGELEHDHVFHSLMATGTAIGLNQTEAKKTIESGMSGGMKYPRTAPENNDIKYELNVNQHNQHNQQNDFQSATISINQQKSASDQQQSASENKEPPHNLKAAIKEFIKNSTGSFTTRDIDNEFGLTTRREKNARSSALYTYRESKLIKKDKKTAGKYHILDTSIEWIDLDKVKEAAFPVNLPFNIHDYVSIPTKAIITLAGTFNAGKTAFMLNTLRLNFNQKYDILYLMSEMGPSEFKSRIMSFGDPLSKWKKIKAASKSYDFDGSIQHYNPDGLTVIDFLEEVDGEYFKIASSIREIYDSLGDGVCFMSIQKKSDSEFARGGQATMEKPRLVMTLDYMASQDQAIICALKLTKVKNFKGKNLQGHELHFRLTRGSQMDVVMDWTPSSQVDRKALARQYESGREDLTGRDFTFKTVEGQVVVVKEANWKTWQEKFDNIDVEWELKRIAEDSDKKPFLKYKGYFFQISTMLQKTNNERA